jgi:hypothetical protein
MKVRVLGRGGEEYETSGLPYHAFTRHPHCHALEPYEGGVGGDNVAAQILPRQFDNGRCINTSTRPSRELSLPSVWYRPDISEQISRLSSDVLDKWLAIKEGMSDYGYFSLAGPFPGSNFATVYYQKVEFWFGILGLGSTSSIQYEMRRSRVWVPHYLLGSADLH